MPTNLTDPPTDLPPSTPSSRTRRGKIARLPAAIRDELNRRLDNGEVGARLVAWLNSLPEAQKILAAEFSGSSINEVNLSHWKQGGGFADWCHLQEAMDLLRTFSEESTELAQVSSGQSLVHLLSAPLAVAVGRSLRSAPIQVEPDTSHLRSLVPLVRELANLRRIEQRELHLRLDRERWETAQREIAEEKAKKAQEEKEWEEGRAEREAERDRFVAKMMGRPYEP